MKLLQLIALLSVIVLSSCRTTKQTASETIKEVVRTDTIYRNVESVTNCHDTIRDSVYIREVVTEEGEVKYKERVVYRDKVKYIEAKRDTIYKEATNQKDSTQQSIESKRATTRAIPLWAIVAFLVMVTGIGIYYTRKR